MQKRSLGPPNAFHCTVQCQWAKPIQREVEEWQEGEEKEGYSLSLSVLRLKWLSIVVALARVLVFSLWILRFVFVSGVLMELFAVATLRSSYLPPFLSLSLALQLVLVYF